MKKKISDKRKKELAPLLEVLDVPAKTLEVALTVASASGTQNFMIVRSLLMQDPGLAEFVREQHRHALIHAFSLYEQDWLIQNYTAFSEKDAIPPSMKVKLQTIHEMIGASFLMVLKYAAEQEGYEWSHKHKLVKHPTRQSDGGDAA